jgi:hypothetical protein
MPKITIRRGMIASLLILIAAMLAIIGYDAIAEPTSIVRQSMKSSQKAAALCGPVGTMVPVPWHFHVTDSEAYGNADIEYWFRCTGRFATVKAGLSNSGQGWRLNALVLRDAGVEHDLR